MKTSILATLCYSDIFDFPLTKKETWKYLIDFKKTKKHRARNASLAKQAGKNKKTINIARTQEQKNTRTKNHINVLMLQHVNTTINYQQFEQSLNYLLNEQKIDCSDDFYFLPNHEKIVELRKRREQFSQEKMEIAQKASNILKIIPTIQMIAVSGALAINNTKEDDDIDFFIITKKNTLWITRLLTVLLLLIFGLYRQPRKIKNKICPNMYLADDNLEFNEVERGIFVAREIVQIKTLFQRANTHQKFLQANTWILDYLPHVVQHDKAFHYDTTQYQSGTKIKILSGFIRFIDFILMKLQIFYMCRKRTKEVLCRDIIRFHPEDVRSRVETEYWKKLSDLM